MRKLISIILLSMAFSALPLVFHTCDQILWNPACDINSVGIVNATKGIYVGNILLTTGFANNYLAIRTSDNSTWANIQAGVGAFYTHVWTPKIWYASDIVIGSDSGKLSLKPGSGQVFVNNELIISAGHWFGIKEESTDINTLKLVSYNPNPVTLAKIGAWGSFWINGSATLERDLIVKGNVGIGTNNPQAKLHVSGNALFTKGIYIHPSTSSDSFIELYGYNDSTWRGHIRVKDVSENWNYYIIAKASSTGNVGSNRMWSFEFKDPDGNYYIPLQIFPNKIYATKSVGIGTSSPSEKLEVAGNIKAKNIYLNQGQNEGSIYYVDIIKGYNDIRFRLGTNSRFYFQDSSGNTKAWIDYSGNAYFSGKVGIGTNNPQAKLDVNGDIKADGVIRGYVLSSNRYPVGLEFNILFNAPRRYKVTQTGSTSFNLDALFDGKLVPTYTPDGVDPNNPVVILIEGLPAVHTQAGAWVGWTTRYWPPKRFKIEGYDENTGTWVVFADYSNKDYNGYDFLVKVPKPGVYTKLRITIYEGSGYTGANGYPRVGLSEIFFIHPEAGRIYSGLLPSSMWEVNGRVGIGTNNPQAKLHVYENAGGTTLKLETANPYWPEIVWAIAGTNKWLLGVDPSSSNLYLKYWGGTTWQTNAYFTSSSANFVKPVYIKAGGPQLTLEQATSGSAAWIKLWNSADNVDWRLVGDSSPNEFRIENNGETKFSVDSSGNINVVGDIYDLDDGDVNIGENLYVAGAIRHSDSETLLETTNGHVRITFHDGCGNFDIKTNAKCVCDANGCREVYASSYNGNPTGASEIQFDYDFGGDGAIHIMVAPKGDQGDTISWVDYKFQTDKAEFPKPLHAPALYDYNNNAYYVDPAGTSNLNDLKVNGKDIGLTFYKEFTANLGAAGDIKIQSYFVGDHRNILPLKIKVCVGGTDPDDCTELDPVSIINIVGDGVGIDGIRFEAYGIDFYDPTTRTEVCKTTADVTFVLSNGNTVTYNAGESIGPLSDCPNAYFWAWGYDLG